MKLIPDNNELRTVDLDILSNSHVNQFYHDFDTPDKNKIYKHGPREKEFGTTIGVGTDKIITNALKFINRRLRGILKNEQRPIPTKPFLIQGFDKQGETLKLLGDKARICLVGHSRGGYAAILIAQLLPFPVYFIGLYDAVGMHLSYTHGGKTDHNKIMNASYVYHAQRSDMVRSRNSFIKAGSKVVGAKNSFSTKYFLFYSWRNRR